MRVLLISGSLPPMRCGVGEYTMCLAKALAKREDATVAILSDVAAGASDPKEKVEVLPVVEGWTLADAAKILRRIRDWRPDIVHIQYHTQGYGRHMLPRLLPSLLRLRKVRVVQSWHECFYASLARGLPALPNLIVAGEVVVVKPDYKSMMHPWYRWLGRHKRFHFIPNASSIPPVRLSDQERSSVRAKHAPAGAHLVAFFGFPSPGKGMETLFEIVDPRSSCLVLICDLSSADPMHRTFHTYHEQLLDRIDSEPWAGRVAVTGFLPSEEVGRILAAADAVVFPFRDGGGIWNTSTHAARLQGTFVLVTARERHGYDAAENVYYAVPGDVAEMRRAVASYMGCRKTDDVPDAGWESIAEAHMQCYSNALAAHAAGAKL